LGATTRARFSSAAVSLVERSGLKNAYQYRRRNSRSVEARESSRYAVEHGHSRFLGRNPRHQNSPEVFAILLRGVSSLS
jgi:hypothetical protein